MSQSLDVAFARRIAREGVDEEAWMGGVDGADGVNGVNGMGEAGELRRE
jgi:hypothetical protein